MKLDRNGEFILNKTEAGDFSMWLANHPKERYFRFNKVVLAYMQFKMNSEQLLQDRLAH